VDTVDEVIEEVVELDGTLIEPTHLEASLDDVAPAEQHLALII
jgi:hypothetical protein